MNPNAHLFPLLKIGIIGGGQLARMMALAGKRMGFQINVLDPTLHSPAGQLADFELHGGFYDSQKLAELANCSDVLTYDIEHIDTQTLTQLQQGGAKIYPRPQLLDIIQDKYLQKQTLLQGGLPIAPFMRVDGSLEEALTKFGYPAVQKASKGGYDGRGVAVLRQIDDLPRALPGETFLEKWVNIKKELAVIVVRGLDETVKCYQVVEMEFDPRANICDIVIAPARISESLTDEACRLAVKTVEVLDGVGVFGIELFLTDDDRILLNEVAPRPHNSGHYTIEACVTSQFEQHLRAIAGLPLGDTQLYQPAVMVNLLGEEGYFGTPLYEGIREALAVPGLSLYLYGKQETRPFRKMGHITIIRPEREEAISLARDVRRYLKVKAVR